MHVVHAPLGNTGPGQEEALGALVPHGEEAVEEEKVALGAMVP